MRGFWRTAIVSALCSGWATAGLAIETEKVDLGRGGVYDGTVTIERDASGNMTFKDHGVTLATLAELLVGSSVAAELTNYVKRDGTLAWTGNHDAGGFDLGNIGTTAARVLHLISEPDEGTEGGVNLVTPMGLEGTATVTFHGGSGEVSLLGQTVALGAETSGNYVGSLVQGSGIQITQTPGEGHTPTVSHSEYGYAMADPGAGYALRQVSLTNGHVNGGVWSYLPDTYYSKTNLQTSGQAAVHWGNLTNTPTSYAARDFIYDGRGVDQTLWLPLTAAVRGDGAAVVREPSAGFTSFYAAGTEAYVMPLPQRFTKIKALKARVHCAGACNVKMEVKAVDAATGALAIYGATASAVASGQVLTFDIADCSYDAGDWTQIYFRRLDGSGSVLWQAVGVVYQ